MKEKKLLSFAQAVYDGGIRLLEITYNAADPESDEQTAENIKFLTEKFEGRMLIGAGTVLTEKQVELTKRAGGKFIISPDEDFAVIKKTRELGLVSIPGALIPTEIKSAYNSGADFVKLFPVTNMGPAYVKAVKAPLSHIRLLMVGGVNEKNMAEYLNAGVVGFGIGSDIVDKKAIYAGDFDKITRLAAGYVKVVNNKNS